MQDFNLDPSKVHNVWDEADAETQAKILRLKKRSDAAKIKIDDIDLFSARICLYLGWDAYKEFKATPFLDKDKIDEFTRLSQAAELLIKQKMQWFASVVLASNTAPNSKHPKTAINKIHDNINEFSKIEMEGLEQ